MVKTTEIAIALDLFWSLYYLEITDNFENYFNRLSSVLFSTKKGALRRIIAFSALNYPDNSA